MDTQPHPLIEHMAYQQVCPNSLYALTLKLQPLCCSPVETNVKLHATTPPSSPKRHTRHLSQTAILGIPSILLDLCMLRLAAGYELLVHHCRSPRPARAETKSLRNL